MTDNSHDDSQPLFWDIPEEPLFTFQQLILPRGLAPNWESAAHGISCVDEDDLDFIAFAMGISEDTHGGVSNALHAARSLLREDLNLLQLACEHPQEYQLQITEIPDGQLLTATDLGAPLHPTGVFGAILRLSLMYIIDSAGFIRPVPELDGAPSEAPVAEPVITVKRATGRCRRMSGIVRRPSCQRSRAARR